MGCSWALYIGRGRLAGAAGERSWWQPVEFNGAVVLSLECAPRGRRNGGAASLWKGRWRRRGLGRGCSARRDSSRSDGWSGGVGRRRKTTAGSGPSWAKWAASPGLARSIKKAEALLGRRGLGRGKGVGRGWDGKEGGGRAESIARAKIQNIKRKSILMDFWIKIGLEIE
jgi:hypothetical protein